MRPKIAIVNSSSFGKVFPEFIEELQKFAEVERIQVPKDISPEEFLPHLVNLEGIIASVTPKYPAELIAKLPKLVAITRHGIGFDNINIEAATENQTVVTKVDGIIEQNAVAEQSVALILTAARKISAGHKAVIENRWADRANFVGLELANKNFGLVGCGNIGRQVGKIMKNGFGMDVLVFDPNVSNEEIQELGFTASSLENLFQKSEVISLNASANSSNYQFINKELLNITKEGVVIVNTARGELVNQNDLLEALNSKKVGVYATDVIENEPASGDHPLVTAKNTIVVPHLGGYTYESLAGMGETMVRNMRQIFVEKIVPEETINKELTDKGLKNWV